MEILIPVCVFLFLLSILIPALSLAPWVPTRMLDIERLLKLIHLKAGDTFLEIGSGDGRVSLILAKHFPHSHIRGVEFAFPFYFLWYMRAYIYGKPTNLSLVFWNAFCEDFSKYDGIYVYGMPEQMQSKIVPKFLAEAKKWAKLYSYIFSIPKEYSESVVSHGGENQPKIHVLEKK